MLESEVTDTSLLKKQWHLTRIPMKIKETLIMSVIA